jgi:hypothetical protein
MDSRELGRIFHEFEEDRAKELARIRVKGWVLWQIVKPPLFYHLVNKPPSSEDKDQKKGEGELSTQGRKKTLSRLGKGLKLLFQLLFLRKDDFDGIVLSREIAKNEVDRAGAYFDPLLDTLPLNVPEHRFLVIELSFRKPIRRDRQKVRPHFRSEGFFFFTTIMRKWTWIKNRSRIRSEAEALTNEIRSYFDKKGVEFDLSGKRMEAYILNFFGEYQVYKWIFKRFRPRAAFFTDQVGKGKLAALLDLGIHAIEFQHGLIHRYKKDYIHSSAFAPFKREMVLPDLIATKGDLFTRELMKGGFWSEEELYTLGSYRAESFMRSTRTEDGDEVKGKLLFFTQWTMVDEGVRTIRFLKPLLEELGIELWIKPHPRTHYQHLDRYRRAADNASRILILAAEDPIKGFLGSADLVLGFYSTTLVEALFFGIPAITIGTSGMPKGLHDHLVSNDGLEKAIRPIGIEELHSPLRAFYTSSDLRRHWRTDLTRARRSLYEPGYVQNLKGLVKKFLE